MRKRSGLALLGALATLAVASAPARADWDGNRGRYDSREHESWHHGWEHRHYERGNGEGHGTYGQRRFLPPPAYYAPLPPQRYYYVPGY